MTCPTTGDGAPSSARPATTTDLRVLAEQRFVSLTTFRRSGAPVPTPVWVGWDDDALVVTTPRGSGKVGRLRQRSDVELTPCSRTGRVAAGELPVRATAQVLDDSSADRRLRRVLRRKYRTEYLAVMALERLGSPFGADRVVLRITPLTTQDVLQAGTADQRPPVPHPLDDRNPR